MPTLTAARTATIVGDDSGHGPRSAFTPTRTTPSVGLRPADVTSCAAPTATAAAPSGGGGGAPPPAPAQNQQGGSAPGTPSNTFGYIVNNNTTPLSAGAVVTSAASVPWSTGGDVVAGAAGFSIPPQPGLPGAMNVSVQP